MKPEDIKTIEDLIQLPGEEKVRMLFEEYLVEVIGQKNQNEEVPFEYWKAGKAWQRRRNRASLQ